MQEGWSYIKETEDFLEKIQNMGKIPRDSILVTADVVGLYPSVPNNGKRLLKMHLIVGRTKRYLLACS